jgi:integrase/recombinase XerD
MTENYSTTKSLVVAQPKAVSADISVNSLYGDWLAALGRLVEAGELAETTRQTYARGMAKFLTWSDGRESVDADLIREWKAALKAAGCKPGTVNTWLAGVRAFFAWALGARRLAYNPTLGIKGASRKGTTKAHKRAALTDSEIMRVLALPDRQSLEGKRNAAILNVMAYTGARTCELQRADLGDLKTIGDRLTLAVRGKGHAEADELIVITTEAETALRDWLGARGDKPGPLFLGLGNRNRGRLSLRAMRGIVKGTYKAAGVVGSDKTTHSLRHTAITNAVKHGAPIQAVQAMARHANITTTMIYYHESERTTRPAEDFISYGAR